MSAGKSFIGVVISDRMDKSIVVRVEYRVKHRVGKYITRSTKIHAHDEANRCKIGDRVKIRETRPISKMKRWAFVDIVND